MTRQNSNRSTKQGSRTSSNPDRRRTNNRRSSDRNGNRSDNRHSPERRPRKDEPSPAWLIFARTETLGILLVFLGILTLISLILPEQGQFTTAWLHLLKQGFGWGAYLSPLGFGALGLALLMHGFGRLPSLNWDKIAGLLLMILMLLGLTHLFSLATAPDAWTLVVEGRAGGLLGWLIGEGMGYALGPVGAYVLIIAMLIVGLILLIGRSTSEIGVILWNWWGQIQGRWQDWQAAHPPAGKTKPTYTVNGRANRPPTSPEAEVEAPHVEPKRPLTSPAPTTKPVEPPTIPLSTPLRHRSAMPQWPLPRLQDVLEALSDQDISQAEIEKRVEIIERTMQSFGVPARVIEVNQGPVITQFGIEPGFVTGRGGKQTKVKVSQISGLADDLALALAASPIRIEAPVPGRSIVGIEVPNQEIAKVSLRGVMETEAFEKLRHKTQLPIALGEDVSGEPIVADLLSMPHLLIAGATGSGKSVCINAIIAGFLCTNSPEILRMIMVDPKRVELTGYNDIPHLLAPVIVDLERVVGTLKWVTREMEHRYKQFAKVGARNIEDFNKRITAGGPERLPYIVVIIDELADLMMVAPDEVEKLICRIAQMARATGIHLIIATQRPSVDVVTGLIKANFPARVSFMVTSSVDSRVIIDTVGAERLLGQGDMLFMSPSASQVMRLQGCFVSDSEINRLVGFWKKAAQDHGMPANAADQMVQGLLPNLGQPGEPEVIALPGQEDELINKAIEIIQTEGKASTTLLQRRLRIGYARAARIIEVMQEQGLIGPDQGGSRGRQVLGDSNGEQTE